uniref:C2H2-type domain-containing protein n=1 Tax=Balaenoptera musculus TaxID=9771 RepID=A0A8C0DEL6_BALMU
MAQLELRVEPWIMDRGLSQDSCPAWKNRPKSQESPSTEAISGDGLPSSMNLERYTMGDSWRSTVADDWKSENESEKQKMYSVSVGPVEYEQGQLVTPDGDWENAEVVGKCSFNSDYVSSQRFLIKEHFHQTDSGVHSLQYNFVLQNHQEILVEKKPCKGNPCGKVLEKLCKLNEHGKYTNQSIYFSTHEIINTGEKCYGYKESGDFFTHRSHLSQFMRTHSKEKSYDCNECWKAFKKLSSLSHHLRNLSREKACECNECGKSFWQSVHLILHQRIHTGEKPYKCNKCGKSSSQNSHLNVHQRTHTRENPYKCDECRKSFSGRCNLNVPKRTHTGEKPYKCNECGKT